MSVRTTDTSLKGFGPRKVYRGRSLPFYSTQKTGGGTSLSPLPSIVLDGLVLYLDAGNTSSYPGSGTTWTDLSSSGKNATLSNGPTYSSDDGGSIVFDGVNDFASIGSPSPLSGTQLFTFEIWVNFTSISGNYGGLNKSAWLFAGGTGGGGGQPELAVLSADNTSFTPDTLNFGRGSGGTVGSCQVSVSSLMSNGNWYQIVLVRSSTNTQEVYLNGVQIGTGNVSNSFSDGITNFGSIENNSNYSGYLNGKISNIKIYNRALTAAEVQQNYNALVGRFSPSIVLDGLVLNLDAGNTSSYSGTGDTWTDLSGNGNNATRTNSSEVVYNSNGWFDWTDGPASDTTQGCFTLPGSSFTLGANFTIEVWNYYDAASTPGSILNPWNHGCLWTNSASADWSSGAGNNNGFLFGYNSFVYRNTSASETQVDYITNPTTQTWHQHILVVNSGTGTVYVDKSSVATLSNFRTIGQSNGTLGIGIADLFGSSYRGEYDGFISIVRVYTKALTASEVEQNYNALVGRFSP